MNKKYNVMAINPGHNGSSALVSDGVLVFYGEEERFSRAKYDGNPFRSMLYILINYHVDELILGGTTDQFPKLPWTGEDPYSAFVRKFNPNVKITNLGNLHHLGHAAAAFYNSGFETAVALIVDGAGSYHRERVGDENAPIVGGFETETIYQCSYPHEFNAVYKRYFSDTNLYFDNGIQEFDNSVTITKAYEAISYYLGFGFIEAGKTMGLAPYGQLDESIPPFFINNKGNKNLLIPSYPAGAFVDENRFPYLHRYMNPSEWHNDFTQVREVDKNLAFHVQLETETAMMDLIQKALDTTGESNVVMSGGFALNCVANYKFLKKFPDVNFYIDPIAHDGGTAIGLARYGWFKHSGSTDISPLTSVYLSISPDFNQLKIAEEQISDLIIKDATIDDVSDLIIDQNIVALFQGRAEGGPRALGNRSLLFDPRAIDGKDIVNGIKMREWFRPFAGSVLEEHAEDWFDMAGLSSSPFMMYAVDVLVDKVGQIPAVCHVDNTCRVQTVNRDENLYFYNLIEAFYKKTDVPLLMNTSLNLAGQPLVETVFDVITTMFNSNINYVYFPEVGKLATKKNG